MSRGIVAGKPNSGNPNGKVMVTEGAIDPTQPLEPGTILKYTEQPKANDGDLADFDIDPATGMPINIVQATAGIVYTGDVTGDITVGAGQSVMLKAAIYEGTIINNGGYLTIVNQSVVSGKIQSATAGSYIFMNGSSFDGKLESSNGGYLSVVNSSVTGKLTSNGNKFVAVQGCTITGKSEVVNAASTNCSGNTLNGSPISGCGK